MNSYKCGDYYDETSEEWLICPECGLRPKRWTFNNGRYTGCGCGVDECDHFSIRAESIMSVYSSVGSVKDYNTSELRDNWNHWVLTKEIIFVPVKGKTW